ncbi:MAG: sulfotransferase family 2 domain-containing protein [Acidobacteriota bacterium]
MPVYHQHQLVHIHIPKTAGTAVEGFFHGLGDMVWGPRSWLGQQRRDGRWWELQHLTYRELVSMTGFQYAAFRSFAVVRNPYQRLLSDYFWHAAPPRERFASLAEFLSQIPRDMDRRWDDAIRGADRDTANLLIHVRPQSHYAHDALGRQLVDEVLRFEQLGEDLERLLQPHELTPGFVRPPRTRRLEDHLEPRQIERINEIYASDFERFGYEKLE